MAKKKRQKRILPVIAHGEDCIPEPPHMEEHMHVPGRYVEFGDALMPLMWWEERAQEERIARMTPAEKKRHNKAVSDYRKALKVIYPETGDCGGP